MQRGKKICSGQAISDGLITLRVHVVQFQSQNKTIKFLFSLKNHLSIDSTIEKIYVNMYNTVIKVILNK